MTKKYINPGPIIFTAVIQRSDTANGATYIHFPYDLKATYGVGNLVPFKATFDNRVTYRGSLAKMGGPDAMILLRKDVRGELGKDKGESVEVKIELDDKPRELPIADDMKTELEKFGLWKQFETLAFTHRREYVQWIEEAKRPETRKKRIEKMCQMIQAKYSNNR